MEHQIHGTPVVPGVGFGPVIRPGPRPQPPVGAARAGSPEVESEKFHAARNAVIERLGDRASTATGVAADVLSTTAAIAADPELDRSTRAAIDGGNPAVQAVWTATNTFIEKFREAGGILAERTTDLQDIRDRIVAELLDLPEPGVPIPDTPSVLLADDLAPADTALLDPARIEAIAIRLGGPTSHTAIIARQLGIPCVVGLRELDSVPSGAHVLVDGAAGVLVVDPDPAEARERKARAQHRAEEIARWSGAGRTSDGHGVDLLANVQDGEGARAAAAGVAVGVGLFRTELEFLNSVSEPGVQEQSAAYREVLDAFNGGKVVVRTLDAGSDKPMPFLPREDEDNPALGVRGLRVATNDPGILDRQLEAIAQAARGGTAPWVMAPMVSTPAEARDFAERTRAHGLIPGVMIEVPAAALRCRQILREVDFVSIGTNDLSQYTMAADRLSPDLSGLCDPWQPAVLDLVRMICEAGAEAGKPVGVCGEAAADPLLGIVLVGLGVDSLSAAHTALPAVGAALGRVDLATCQQAARAALAAADADGARAAVRELLD